MKVLLLSGAASMHTIRWANGLAAAGVDLVLATQHELIESVDEAIRVIRLPYSGSLGYFRNVPRLRTLLAQLEPDLVNAHYASGYGTLARLVKFHPYILSVWGSDVYRFPNQSFVHKWLVRRNCMAADQVSSTSHAMAEQTKRIVPKLDDIEVIPFGINPETFNDSKSAKSDDRSVITVGTVKVLDHLYGIDLLLKSFALVRQRMSVVKPQAANRLRLRIVGSGPDSSKLQRLAADLGISDVTTFTGRVPHERVPMELAKLDIYVALSRSESFGVAVLEAGACGKPVIVSDVGGLPEVVVNGETGYVVRREDVKAASGALESLIDKPKLRFTMGKNGRDYVLKNYQWERNVDMMMSLYERVLSGFNSGTI